MDSPRRHMHARRLLGVLALTALTALVFAPALGAFLVRDDFMQIASARLVGAPWPLFFQDHFIPPGAFFRPLGFAVLWLTTALAGTQLPLHYAVALALHVAVALALWRVLARTGAPPLAAWLLALVFALHPIAIGTSLWLADRFDLIAALCMLLALAAAADYRARRRRRDLGVVLAASLLAMLAKEIGLLGIIPVTLVWLRAARWRPRLLVPRRALVALWLMPVIFLAWRALVLGGMGGGGEIQAQAPLALLARGGGIWLADLAGYLSFWPRSAPWQRAVQIGAALLVGAALLWPRARAALAGEPLRWGLGGAALFLLPAAVQAPVARFNARALDASLSAIDAAMQTRFYYVALTGLVIALAALCTRVRQPAARRLLHGGLALLALGGGVAAHTLADGYQARSQAMRPLAQAAVTALAALPLPPQDCQVYLLDTTQPPESGVYAPLEGVVKALAPDLSHVAHCLIQTETTPFAYLLPRATLAHTRTAPLVPRPGLAPGQALLTLHGMEVGVLRLPPDTDAAAIPGAWFLAWDGTRFHDVTAAVRSGERQVEFH